MNARKYRVFAAGFACITWSASIALAQTNDIGFQANTQSSLGIEVQREPTSLPVEAGNDAGQLPMWNVAPTSPSDDGITVSMLNGKSRLKIFGSLSALTVFSTDRPFAPGMPLFLLPESPFGLSTNT